jgi:alanine racemase
VKQEHKPEQEEDTQEEFTEADRREIRRLPKKSRPSGRIPFSSGLDEDLSSTWIEVDRSALAWNYHELKRFMGEDVEVVPVVKGNAYGHGVDPVVPVLEHEGVTRFQTFSAAEAAAIMQVADDKTRIMVTGHVPGSAVPWVVAEGNVEPWLATHQAWPLYKEELERQGSPVRFHVKVETGMHRTGLLPEEALQVAQEVADHPHAELEGVATHLAGAEDSRNRARVAQQKRVYHTFLEELEGLGIRPKVRHIASSSAAILDEDVRLDLVRVGIAMYGFWPTREVYHRHRIRNQGSVKLRLVRALEWKSRLMHVQGVMDGDFIGYGLSAQAEGMKRIGVIPVGYSDGFSRDLSNQGHVLVGGRRATILGVVNMNMVQVNLTHVPHVDVGDEVVLVGVQGDQEISVTSFAEHNNVVNYELMSRLPVDIPRVLVDRGGDQLEPGRLPRWKVDDEGDDVGFPELTDGARRRSQPVL